jgi:hypothetical protein
MQMMKKEEIRKEYGFEIEAKISTLRMYGIEYFGSLAEEPEFDLQRKTFTVKTENIVLNVQDLNDFIKQVHASAATLGVLQGKKPQLFIVLGFGDLL